MSDDLQTTIQEWIENVKLRKVIADASEAMLWAKRGVLRLFIPADLLEGGAVPQGDLATILSMIRIEAVHPKQAAVVTPGGSSRAIGIYTYTADEDEEAAELTYLSEDRTITILRNTLTGEQVEMNLGGRLTMFQMERKLLITDSLRRLQKKVNHAATAENSNLGLAGWVARLFLNAQMPGDYKRDAEGNEILDASGQPTFVPEPVTFGPETVVYVQGTVTDGENGGQRIEKPQYIREQPVTTDVFTKTKEASKKAMLFQARQAHVFLAVEAAASGESRLQARGDYENSLLKTAAPVEEAFVWAVETAVSMAASMAGEANPFDESRISAQAQLDLGVITPKEKDAAKGLFEAKVISHRTALKWIGIDNPETEIQQIIEEQATNGEETEGAGETEPGTSTAE